MLTCIWVELMQRRDPDRLVRCCCLSYNNLLGPKNQGSMIAELIVGSGLEIGCFSYMSLIIKAIYLSHIRK